MSDENVTLSKEEKRRFMKLRVKGSNACAIMPPEEVEDFCDGGEYIAESIILTQAEYDLLPEFEGF